MDKSSTHMLCRWHSIYGKLWRRPTENDGQNSREMWRIWDKFEHKENYGNEITKNNNDAPLNIKVKGEKLHWVKAYK